MDLAINVSPGSTPLHRQIYEEVRAAIFSGRLPSGRRVPSTRQLAQALGVSRATVTLAYDYLLSEGYFEAFKGSGTFVSRRLPDDLIEPSPQAPATSDMPACPDRQLSAYGQSLHERELGYTDDQPEIQFSFGRPDLDQFPMRIWSQLMSRHCRKRNFSILDCPSQAAGYLPLKEAIVEYLARARAVIAKPEQVVVVNGSQQGLDLVTRVLVDRGDLVAVEEPCYMGALRALQAQGAETAPIPVDNEGLRLDYLKTRFARQAEKGQLKLLYVTPSHQYPTGVVLSLPRRLELLSWAASSSALIIEDDYDSEFRYSGRPIPALCGIDRSASVIYLGTFSKVLLPALRLGYIVVPEDLINVFTRAKWLIDRHSSLLQQQVLADFISEGHLERHVRRMRARYERRRKLVIETIETLFGDNATIFGDSAGINVLVRFVTSRSSQELIEKARKLKIGIASTRQLYQGDAPQAEFLLNYGGLKEHEIVEGLERLGSIL